MGQMCKHGNCTKEVPPGEGVAVTAAGWRVKFCSWKHAAEWVLAMGAREKESKDRFLRAIAELTGTPRGWR